MSARDLDRDEAKTAGGAASPPPHDLIKEIAAGKRDPAPVPGVGGFPSADEVRTTLEGPGSPAADEPKDPPGAAASPSGEAVDRPADDAADPPEKPAQPELGVLTPGPAHRESYRSQLGSRREQALAAALEDANLMVAHAAGRERAVSGEAVRHVVAASRAYTDRGVLTPAEEESFWTGFQKISKDMDPVTAESIRWSTNRSKTRLWALGYVLLGVFLLAVVLYFQREWVYIRDASARITAVNDQIAELPVRPQRVGERTIAPIVAEGVGAEAIEVVPPLTTEALAAEIARLERERDALFLLLWDYVPGIAPADAPQAPGNIFYSGTEAERLRYEEELARWQELQQTTQRSGRDYSLAKATSFLTIQSAYVLPALYGLLGTVAFILRSVSQGIRDAVLTETAAITYLVRIPLGMLAGLSVGWFLNDETLPTGFGAIQPLALAFVAGYSVELVFAAMDRLIGAFTAGERRA